MSHSTQDRSFWRRSS